MNEHITYTVNTYDSLSLGYQSELLRQAVVIAADAFEQDAASPLFQADVHNHLKRHRVIFAYEGLRPVAFTSTNIFKAEDFQYLYISGMAVHTADQARGVGQGMVRRVLAQYREEGIHPEYIAGRTGNPVVARARAKYSETVHPIQSQPTPAVLLLSDHLRQHLQMTGEFNQATLVTKDVYDNPINKRRKLSGHAQTDSFFSEHVGLKDAVFIVGSLRQ